MDSPILLILLAFSKFAAAQDSPAAAAGPSAAAFSPFKPGIAVIIAILTMFFCITFLILLYAKHCNNNESRNGVVSYYFGGANTATTTLTPNFAARKNSGVDRSIIESLPVFRFGSLRGQKEGLECAVCLNRFEPVEVLRLLPKCKHAFHVECVDTWLDAHSTCPLCRYRVDPEDLLLVIEPEMSKSSGEGIRRSLMEAIRRISGRHSYAGAAGVIREETASYRRSCDEVRKDGLLMMKTRGAKVDHRIIISETERWSDVEGADLLYLRSEMVMNEGGGLRSVSERMGMESRRSGMVKGRREAGAVERWTAWISQPRDVRSVNVS